MGGQELFFESLQPKSVLIHRLSQFPLLSLQGGEGFFFLTSSQNFKVLRSYAMKQTIGLIGGGQMGEALVKGIIASGLYRNEDIYVSEPKGHRREHLQGRYGIKASPDNVIVFEYCQIIILAVEPQAMELLLEGCRERIHPHHILTTVAAGLPMSFYLNVIGKKNTKLIRVMPNAPALVQEGATAISHNANITDEELGLVKQIFQAVGEVIILEERDLDAVTGLSGSGPAYVFSFVEALIEAGVKSGLPWVISEKLAIQTVSGSIKLLKESGEHSASLRSKVTSPAGTTISAIHVLEKFGFHGIVMDIVESAVNRSKELGKEE